MEQDQEDGGLFNITLDSDSAPETTTSKPNEPKLPRDFQSDENFKQQLKAWRPKVETGELYKNLRLPIDNPSKPKSQEILHAVEELYFLKRYEEAVGVASKALEGELVVEFRAALERYRGRCETKLGMR